MSFTHLTTTERNELYKLRVTGQLSMSEIGRRMNRDKSTISRELSRNTDECRNVYFPDTAEVKMKARREKAKVKFQNVSANTIAEVKQRLDLLGNKLKKPRKSIWVKVSRLSTQNR